LNDIGVIALVKQALWLVLLLSAPPIIAASIVGLVVAIVQAATQIQEQTLSYAIKFVAVVLAILATTTLGGGALYRFSDQIFSEIGTMVIKR
jgi:type III secretion protein S